MARDAQGWLALVGARWDLLATMLIGQLWSGDECEEGGKHEAEYGVPCTAPYGAVGGVNDDDAQGCLVARTWVDEHGVPTSTYEYQVRRRGGSRRACTQYLCVLRTPSQDGQYSVEQDW